MTDDIEITPAVSADAELVEAMQRLIPQLSPSASIPGLEDLRAIVASSCTALLLARDRSQQDRIIGSLTLTVFRVTSGVRGWIEDVVVDSSARGRGAGEALCREALRLAGVSGASIVDLTSRPSREAANRLYRRIGFQLRETNFFRYDVPGDSAESG
jgi:ribosomal protein S18 acetylase RimI-like enzyme